MSKLKIEFNEDELIEFLLDNKNSQDDCVKKLKDYYNNGETRHLYSNLTKHLLNKSSDAYEYLIDRLYKILDDDNYWNDDKEEKIALNISKLYDHISLEAYRIQYNNIKNLQVKSFFTGELKKQEKLLNDFVNSQKEESKNQQKDLITHTLTVISIFTAVIFTALTGFNALTTIAAEIIAKNNMAIIFAVLFGTAIISVDIYYILLRFICVLLDKKGFRFGKYIRNMNFIGIAIIILILLISLSFPNYFII